MILTVAHCITLIWVIAGFFYKNVFDAFSSTKDKFVECLEVSQKRTKKKKKETWTVCSRG